MRDTLEQRLATLDSEYQSGKAMIAELDHKRQNLTRTLLRIEGAMEVLREVLGREPGKKAP